MANPRQSNELVARLPLVGSINQRNIDASIADTKDQRFVNCIPEFVKNSYTGETHVYMNKRPGYANTKGVLLTDGIGSAAFTWTGLTTSNNVCIAMYTSNTWNVYRFNHTSSITTDAGLQALASAGRHIGNLSETIIGGTPYLVAVEYNNSDESLQDAHYTDATTAATISDGDFPSTGVGNFAHSSGWEFFQTPAGNIHNSDLNSLSSWNALGVIPANSSPDKALGVFTTGNSIAAFGTNSVDFYEVAGTAPPASPLKLITEKSLSVGAVGQNAITQLDDLIAWISSSTGFGGYQLMILTRDGIKQISNPMLTKILSSVLTVVSSTSVIDVNSVYVEGISLFGQHIILVTVETDANSATKTLGYVVDSDFWFEWLPGVAGLNPTHAAIADHMTYIVCAYATTGKVYDINKRSPVYQDDSSAYSMVIQLGPTDFETGKRKFISYYELIADTQASGTTTLEISDDDGTTWSTLGTFDMTADIKRIYQGGSFKPHRSHRLTHSANTAFRGMYLDVYGTLGTS